MPIYEYRCDGCGHEMELIQKMSDDPLKDCPACQSSELKKMISASGFRLKGSGWYETDFKNKKNKNNDAESKGNTESKGNKESKTKETTQSKNTSSTASSGGGCACH